MPESVFLDFVPPNDNPDLAKLLIYEGPTKEGPFTLIETVDAPAIGVYPNYISHYTTNLATALDNWFTIRWQDVKGALTPYADAIQGGTRSVVSEIVSRVLTSSPTTNEQAAAQEAAGVVEEIFGMVNPDPTLVKQRQYSGMTLLTLARVRFREMLTGGRFDSWTAGLVSMKSSNSASSAKEIRDIIAEAQRMLGLSTARVAQVCLPSIAGGLSEIVSADISRLMIEVE